MVPRSRNPQNPQTKSNKNTADMINEHNSYRKIYTNRKNSKNKDYLMNRTPNRPKLPIRHTSSLRTRPREDCENGASRVGKGGLRGVRSSEIRGDWTWLPQTLAICNTPSAYNGFQKVKLFDADYDSLRALGKSGVEVMVGIPNDLLATFATSLQAAEKWVSKNVSTRISTNHVNIRCFFCSSFVLHVGLKLCGMLMVYLGRQQQKNHCLAALELEGWICFKPSDVQKESKKVKKMVVRLRLSRFGCKNKPFYRVMAADSRSPRDDRLLEVLGYYNPLPDMYADLISRNK
ncbi:hypothetical protein RHMOL_Rhmol08G0217500 [Rhododendron molle]|uniref:Uncharacterized protein n=1 Tax=Rhododendron molle TaxID=49168 RepID=A0ACC0MT01_RHOML|nr:hypothetical protein RHMOL_Rhmol08G0217500 [Rhododendron molle]